MPFVIVDLNNNPTLSLFAGKVLTDELLEDALSGDVLVLNEQNEQLDVSTGMFKKIQESEY